MTPPTDPDHERPLRGGRLTPGVVRIGDTVRRPAGPASDDVAALLRHLEDAGFAGAPRHLGSDERGRDVLAYIDGWVPARFQAFDDAQVRAAGALLRSFHAATRAHARARWGADVVCHHDPGPNNAVFRDGCPIALIDFDLAAPGDALDDVAYMAWTWCVSSKPARGPAARQAAQVRLLAQAYGLDAAGRHRLVDAMLDRQARNAAFWTARGADADADAAAVATAAQVAERVAWSMRERDYTIAHRAAFEAALR